MVRGAALILAVASATSCQFLAPYSAENLCETLVKAECRFAYQCCNAAERQDGVVSQTYGRWRNEEDCVRENLIEVCGFFQTIVESQRAQRFDLDEEKLQECYEPRIEALNACDAETVFDPPDADEDCFARGGLPGEGKVEDGELCFHTFECATEDAVCKPAEADEGEVLVSAKGTCEPPPRAGDPCPDSFCAEGLFCGPNATGDDVCQNQKDTGAPCDSLAECKSQLCEFDTTDFEQKCATPRGNGEACFSDANCASASCVGNVCGGTPTNVDVEVDACDGLGPDEEP